MLHVITPVRNRLAEPLKAGVFGGLQVNHHVFGFGQEETRSRVRHHGCLHSAQLFELFLAQNLAVAVVRRPLGLGFRPKFDWYAVGAQQIGQFGNAAAGGE